MFDDRISLKRQLAWYAGLAVALLPHWLLVVRSPSFENTTMKLIVVVFTACGIGGSFVAFLSARPLSWTERICGCVMTMIEFVTFYVCQVMIIGYYSLTVDGLRGTQ
jgi:hypothetical protein